VIFLSWLIKAICFSLPSAFLVSFQFQTATPFIDRIVVHEAVITEATEGKKRGGRFRQNRTQDVQVFINCIGEGFKAMLQNYMYCRKSGSGWCHNDIQVLGGLIFYYQMVEKDYFDYLLRQYGEKHGADIRACIKADLSA